jgi:hypothetical protein
VKAGFISGLLQSLDDGERSRIADGLDPISKPLNAISTQQDTQQPLGHWLDESTTFFVQVHSFVYNCNTDVLKSKIGHDRQA